MNQKGFVTVSLIVWIPVICSLLFSTFWMIWFLQKKLIIDNLCHEKILKAQEELVLSNNQILSLNPKAWWLFTEKKALDVAILTGPPPVKAAAKIRRKFVVLQQKALSKVQKSILHKGHFLSKAALVSFRTGFHSLNRELNQFWQSPLSGTGRLSILGPGSQIKIRVDDIAPIYKREQEHARTQRIKAYWEIPLRSILPKWILQWVPVHKTWRGQCASHPHTGGFNWEAAIGEGKH